MFAPPALIAPAQLAMLLGPAPFAKQASRLPIRFARARALRITLRLWERARLLLRARTQHIITAPTFAPLVRQTAPTANSVCMILLATANLA